MSINSLSGIPRPPVSVSWALWGQKELGCQLATVVGCLLLKGGMMALARFMYRESDAAEDPVGKGQDL